MPKIDKAKLKLRKQKVQVNYLFWILVYFVSLLLQYSVICFYYIKMTDLEWHIYIYIYVYINFKAINNVLDAKMVLKTHLFVNIFRLIYKSLYMSTRTNFCVR